MGKMGREEDPLEDGRRRRRIKHEQVDRSLLFVACDEEGEDERGGGWIRRGVRFSTKPIIRCVSRQRDEERSPGYRCEIRGNLYFVVDVIGNASRERAVKFNFRPNDGAVAKYRGSSLCT